MENKPLSWKLPSAARMYPAGVKFLWKVRKGLYGDERAGAAVESLTSFDFTEKDGLSENFDRVTYGIVWSQPGYQGRTLPTKA